MDFLTKLSSRKLWALVLGVIAGLALIFGVDEGVINTVAGGRPPRRQWCPTS
jgi:phage shock protein PspC (stress-responsive transcriptional regulator)